MIYLKPLTPENITPFFTWLNDKTAIKYSLSKFQEIITIQDIEQWYAQLLRNSTDYTVGIFRSETDRLIGYAGISKISTINKSGEYFIFIGDKEQWGKGFGTDTTHKIIKHGFEVLQLHRIMLTVSEPNIGGIKAYEKAGFKREGRFRQACYRDGSYHDKIVMSILKDEYTKSY